MSNLLQHAERELDLLGMTIDAEDETSTSMREHLLTMVRTFADEGHSGFSASYALNCLKDLLAYKPLTPLTGADDEWCEVQPGVFQNIRCSRVFKQADRFGGNAYDIDAVIFETDDGTCYTSSLSRRAVSFPYTPTSIYKKRGDAT